jgi:hypothetical protein
VFGHGGNATIDLFLCEGSLDDRGRSAYDATDQIYEAFVVKSKERTEDWKGARSESEVDLKRVCGWLRLTARTIWIEVALRRRVVVSTLEHHAVQEVLRLGKLTNRPCTRS